MIADIAAIIELLSKLGTMIKSVRDDSQRMAMERVEIELQRKVLTLERMAFAIEKTHLDFEQKQKDFDQKVKEYHDEVHKFDGYEREEFPTGTHAWVRRVGKEPKLYTEYACPKCKNDGKKSIMQGNPTHGRLRCLDCKTIIDTIPFAIGDMQPG